MTGDPGLLPHVRKGLCVGITAVRQHCHKQIGLQPITGIRVYQGCRLAGPVHLHGLAGLVRQVHSGLRLVDIVRVVLVELGGFVGQFTSLTALLAVFHPQKTQGDPTLLHFPVYPLVVRHFVDRACLLSWKQPLCDFLLRQGLHLLPVELLFPRPG